MAIVRGVPRNPDAPQYQQKGSPRGPGFPGGFSQSHRPPAQSYGVKSPPGPVTNRTQRGDLVPVGYSWRGAPIYGPYVPPTGYRDAPTAAGQQLGIDRMRQSALQKYGLEGTAGALAQAPIPGLGAAGTGNDEIASALADLGGSFGDFTKQFGTLEERLKALEEAGVKGTDKTDMMAQIALALAQGGGRGRDQGGSSYYMGSYYPNGNPWDQPMA